MNTLAQMMIEYDEGRRSRMYKCTANKWTIGVGWNIEDRGLPGHIIDALLEYAIEIAAHDLDRLVPTWRTADPVRQAALLDWSLQLGATKMATFRNSLRYLRDQQWAQAARNLRLSKWAKQDTPERARRIVYAIEHGELGPGWPPAIIRAAVDIEAAVDARA